MSAAPSTTLVLLALKLRLLRNGLRRSPWQLLGLGIAALYGLAVSVSVVGGLVVLRGSSPQVAGAVVVIGGSALLVAWAVVPLVAFGVDATLDPARLVPFPLPARALVPGLLVGGVVGVPGLVTTVAGAATVVTWSRSVGAAVVAALAAALAVATAVALSRLTTSALSTVLGGRRTRERAVLVLLLVISLLGPAVALAGPTLERTGGGGTLSLVPDPAALERTAQVLSWTPLGWAWGAPAAWAAGSTLGACVRLVLAAATLLAVLAAWSRVLDATLTGGTLGRPAAGMADDTTRHAPVPEAAAPRAGWAGRALDRLETTRTGAVTARCLRYWRRDTRYVTTGVSLLGVPLILVVLAVALPVPGGVVPLLLGPALAFLLGWASHDDVAYDGTALWMVLAASLPGRADRWGRAAAILVWALPLVLVADAAGTALAGRWAVLPAVVGVSLALLGAGQGVCAVASVATPYKVPDAGASPFATPPGSAVAAVVAQAVTSAVAVVLSSPAIALALGALVLGGAALAWSALVVGAALGVGALWLGVRVGAGVLERRGPEVLATLAR